MTETHFFYCADETQLLEIGRILAECCKQQLKQHPDNALIIYLNGELGAGKTTLTRSIVHTFGHQGNVKSPTYTLVEEYQLMPYILYHFDLYRLSSPEELEFMGIRDYFRPQTLCLLEWAARGKGMIPEADLIIQIDYADHGRNLYLFPQTAQGEQLFTNLRNNKPLLQQDKEV